VAAWRDAPFFTDAERAALALAEAVTRLADRPDPVPDEIWDEAARHSVTDGARLFAGRHRLPGLIRVGVRRQGVACSVRRI
jgi:hypothetical protein